MLKDHPQPRHAHLTSRHWLLLTCLVVALGLGISLFVIPPTTGIEGRTLLAIVVAVTAVCLSSNPNKGNQ